MNLLHRLEILFAPNQIHQQLYPPPSIAFRFRRYQASDRGSALDLYDQNAVDRFPEGNGPVFERYLDSVPESFFVAEAKRGGVIACGGVTSVGECVHTLCYGLVDRRFQGLGVGAAITLARLAFATRTPGEHFSFIYAVPKSMGYYQRFGFSETQTWMGVDGKNYPVGILGYNSQVFKPIAAVLRRRGHLIDPSLAIEQDESKIAVIQKSGSGGYSIELKMKEPN
jgi:GNAT superfamily N-acetyltransferase